MVRRVHLPGGHHSATGSQSSRHTTVRVLVLQGDHTASTTPAAHLNQGHLQLQRLEQQEREAVFVGGEQTTCLMFVVGVVDLHILVVSQLEQISDRLVLGCNLSDRPANSRLRQMREHWLLQRATAQLNNKTHHRETYSQVKLR